MRRGFVNITVLRAIVKSLYNIPAAQMNWQVADKVAKQKKESAKVAVKERPQEAALAPAKPFWHIPAAAVLLVIITLSPFLNVTSASFVQMDDDIYVTENARIHSGITWENTKWAFSTTYFGFYYPLTWLSHMLDYQLYGPWAGGHHLTSLILHILNALLLFIVLIRMTSALWKSFFVAAFFAIHPLHVESVAWISERKDVLSTFFWLLCILFYVFYAEKPSVKRYIPVFIAFLLGLLAKPMILTLPFTLLLLDYWPLKRMQFGKSVSAGKSRFKIAALPRLLWEKMPLFLLLPIFTYLTFYAQKEAKAVISADYFPLSLRLGNALVSYCAYLGKMLLPTGLAAYYPLHVKEISTFTAGSSAFLLLTFSLAVLWFFKSRKYLAFGWLWYLGTLVPVIGVIQIGSQSMADRYTYVPLVGIFIAVVWGLAELARNSATVRKSLSALAFAAIIIFAFLTHKQAGYWNNSVSLFERTLALTSGNWFIHNNLGAILSQQGKKDEAEFHFREALRANPSYSMAHMNLGIGLNEKGETDSAIEHFNEALRLDPKSVKILNNLGLALAKQNRFPEAVERFKEAVSIDQDFLDSRNNLAFALLLDGQQDAAIEQYREAARLNPDYADGMNNLGLALKRTGRIQEAIECFKNSVARRPDFFETRINFAETLLQAGDAEPAIEQYRQALMIKPRNDEALNNLGLALMSAGRLPEAAEQFIQIAQNSPEFENARINLGVVMARQKRFAEAAKYFQEVLNINPNSELARTNYEAAELGLKTQQKSKK
jgi:protein O-mannosyl-transferase